MDILSDGMTGGVRERLFAVGEATGAVWTDAAARGTRPLLLFGHAERQNKSKPDVLAFAQHVVRATSYTVAVVDAPCHGGRHRAEHELELIADMETRAAAGVHIGRVADLFHAAIAPQGAREWREVLDGLQELDEVDAQGPVGFQGVALGSLIGIPFVAAEPRIHAAVFGLLRLDDMADAAAQVRVPLQFRVQWDDEMVPRDEALALFDAFGSEEKTLHANRGGHGDVPPFETESALRFFARHLEAA